ncbi:MAG: 4-hydroxyphenylpyruvate dioxygenase [Leptolyngbya sp. SIO4C1]|nr:4-hydroxyphenylpyruvate dioxygenase [Leptolyngbya sp. SIO4C1]
MDFHHVHFYVDDAQTWCDWFIHTLLFQPVTAPLSHLGMAHSRWVQQDQILIRLSSPQSEDDAIAAYLAQHSPGIVDVAFAVTDLEAQVAQATAAGARLIQPIQAEPRWCQVSGWGPLRHTLVEQSVASSGAALLECIDHAVLNVPAGSLEAAARWYAQAFGLELQQTFQIQTAASGLCSQVLVHPQGRVQLPINEPSTPNSQIQEFLEHHCGPGIQHLALRSRQLVSAIATLRSRGLSLLPVPETYYQQLPLRCGYRLGLADWQAIARQQILVDWPAQQPAALLLQTFTQPIFGRPTFFFELIERRCYQERGQTKTATGFGEGNFQALFEAIEREQQARGSLLPLHG